MDLKEIGYETGSWMEMVQDRLKWRLLVLAVLSLEVLLPESCISGLENLPGTLELNVPSTTSEGRLPCGIIRL
jgi:hypothetical protein